MSLTEWSARLETINCNCTEAACTETSAEQALLQEAMRNLRSGLVVPMLIEEPYLSAQYLFSQVGLDTGSLQADVHSNVRHHDSTTTSTMANVTLDLTKVRQLLELDLQLYEFAHSLVIGGTRQRAIWNASPTPSVVP